MTNHTRTLCTRHTHTITERLEYTRGRGRVPPTIYKWPLGVLVLTVNASQDFLEKA